MLLSNISAIKKRKDHVTDKTKITQNLWLWSTKYTFYSIVENGTIIMGYRETHSQLGNVINIFFQIAKTLGSTSIIHRSGTFASDRFAIWVGTSLFKWPPRMHTWSLLCNQHSADWSPSTMVLGQYAQSWRQSQTCFSSKFVLRIFISTRLGNSYTTIHLQFPQFPMAPYHLCGPAIEIQNDQLLWNHTAWVLSEFRHTLWMYALWVISFAAIDMIIVQTKYLKFILKIIPKCHISDWSF